LTLFNRRLNLKPEMTKSFKLAFKIKWNTADFCTKKILKIMLST
jgi:hypothetical protein